MPSNPIPHTPRLIGYLLLTIPLLVLSTTAHQSRATAAPSVQTPPTVAGCTIFPADNIWNTPIDALPVAAHSDAYMETIGADLPVHPDFGSGEWPLGSGAPIGIPYIDVPGTQPSVALSFTYADESDPGPYPIPDDVPIEGGPESDGDRHVLVLDRDECVLYEVFSAYPQPDGSWEAGSGAVFDLNSHALRPDGWTSADAAGLPILPGLVRYDEVASGEIRHALRFTAPQTRREYVWPARHFASDLTGEQYPPMGQRFRLRADFDVTGFSPDVQVILRALQTYGMILADNGSSWYISGAPDERWDNDVLRELRQVTGADFEAVDVSALMVDADSGQVAGTTIPRTTATAVYLPLIRHEEQSSGVAIYPPSPVIGGIVFHDGTARTAAPGSDNWPITWAANDLLYTTWGDGGGFGGTNSDGRVSLGTARIEGGPDDYQGFNIAGGIDGPCVRPFDGKSVGILALDNTLYLWRNGDSANVSAFKFSELHRSDDLGCTWQFTGVRFSREDGDFPASEGFFAPTFLQFGPGYAGARDEFVYIYAPEIQDADHWDLQFPGAITLLRVPRAQIEQRTAYQFFAGVDAGNNPLWATDIAARQPVWTDAANGTHRMAVSYNPGLGRYLLTTMAVNRKGWIGIYDAPEPWGPWTTVLFEQNEERWGEKVVVFNFVNKWLSADGRDFVLVHTEDDRWATIAGSFIVE